jgi:molecular chaperone GrpE (heat shock protein)
MSERRIVWQTLSELLVRLESGVSALLDASSAGNGTSSASVQALEQEVRKLGKVQFKANVLAEKQAEKWAQAMAAIEATRSPDAGLVSGAQDASVLEELCAQREAVARHELLQAIIPALDGLENAISSGQSYLQQRDQAAGSSVLAPAQAALVSPADRAKLAGWLDGLRLVRGRLLAVLEAGGVTPIPTVGHPFDPYLHVAVATTAEGNGPPGTVVAEERAGYRSPDGILRYADVVVLRPGPVDGQTPSGG